MHNNTFSIKSALSDRELVFADFNGVHFDVHLRGAEVTASQRAYIYAGTAFREIEALVDLLSGLAKQSHGWSTTECWESFERDLKLQFSCDRRGHVSVAIELTHMTGGDEDWKVQAALQMELGQMPRLAADAAAFFAPAMRK